MADYDAEFEIPDGVDPYGGNARILTTEGVHHEDPDEASFPCLDIEVIDINGGNDVRLRASTREDVDELRRHLTAALDALSDAVDQYIADAPAGGKQ